MIELAAVEGLVLKQLTPDQAPEYDDLVQANRTHLTRFGDYEDEVAATEGQVAQRFGDESDRSVKLGIWKDGALIGSVVLVHREPPRWGLGYWLSEDATGRGFMTAACSALLEYARSELGATEVLAGVTHGNRRSVAVLVRLGFTAVEEFPTYTRFARRLPIP